MSSSPGLFRATWPSVNTGRDTFHHISLKQPFPPTSKAARRRRGTLCDEAERTQPDGGFSPRRFCPAWFDSARQPNTIQHTFFRPCPPLIKYLSGTILYYFLCYSSRVSPSQRKRAQNITVNLSLRQSYFGGLLKNKTKRWLQSLISFKRATPALPCELAKPVLKEIVASYVHTHTHTHTQNYISSPTAQARRKSPTTTTTLNMLSLKGS